MATIKVANKPGKQVVQKLRGAFLNTEPAQCSIFESGSMVFDCLKGSDIYTIDYFTIDQLDLQAIGPGNAFVLKDKHSDIANYDFVIFNYHPVTMKPFLPPEVVQYFPGLKFAIVLELEPEDPAKHTPTGIFDNFIAIDPSARRTTTITPFPRPLRGKPRTAVDHKRRVPLIGSFGMGTPGKGFEHVVEAINAEFDEAILRVNIPNATYADQAMMQVHRQPYATYLEKLCVRVAKPGIKVSFTYDYMTNDELEAWCADNDLNCFLYIRRQSGLSATTDQCILSGQPLIVSSNDTFRHIHRYIAPYPKMSFKEALATSAPAVAKMQRDWSIEAFQSIFVDMLRRHGLDTPADDGLGRLETSMPAREILFACRGEVPPNDPVSYTRRILDAMGRTGDYYVGESLSYTDQADLVSALFWRNPAVLAVPAPLDPEIASLLDGGTFTNSVVVIEPDVAVPPEANMREDEWANVSVLPRRPLVPYFTALPGLVAVRPHICLIGFPTTGNLLEQVLGKIQREQPDASVLFTRVPGAGAPTPADFAMRLRSLGEQLALTPSMLVQGPIELPATASGIIHWLGAHHLSIIAGDPAQLDAILNIAELALTTERAVAFTRAAPLPFMNAGTFLEDGTIPSIIERGAAAQTKLYNAFTEGRFFASFDALVSFRERSSRDVDPVMSSLPLPRPNGLLGLDTPSWYEERARKRFDRELESGWALRYDAPHVARLQQFLFSAVESASGWSKTARLAAVGDTTRGAVRALRACGYQVNDLQAFERETADTMDCVFGCNAFSDFETARLTITRALAVLRPGGFGVFSFFCRESYAHDDPRENPDFPILRPGDVLLMLHELGAHPVSEPVWQSDRLHLEPSPFSPPPVATLVFFKS